MWRPDPRSIVEYPVGVLARMVTAGEPHGAYRITYMDGRALWVWPDPNMSTIRRASILRESMTATDRLAQTVGMLELAGCHTWEVHDG